MQQHPLPEMPKKNMNPFPHVYVDNYFDNAYKKSIRSTFLTESFTTADGGCPVSNINSESNPFLLQFKEVHVLNELVPRLDRLFAQEIATKFEELSITHKTVSALKNPQFGFFHLTRNEIGTRINFHRDDDRASYQLVFFLGDVGDGLIDTTELLAVDDPDEFEEKGFHSAMQITTYGKTNNGLLCFANTPVAYHGLSKTIASVRHTVAASILHYECR